jgi:hypothetical protein
MKFCTYRATQGLERFPVEQRFRVWGDVHKKLMSSDVKYRRAVNRSRSRIVGSIVTFLMFNSLVTILQRRVANDTTLTVLFIIVTMAAILAYVFFLLHESFRMQCFQNDRVGQKLQAAP